MSYRLLNALARTPMPSSEKNVLMAIACHANNETYETFVGTKTLVAHSGLTRRYLIALRHKLVDSGWLVRTGKVNKKYGTRIYRVVIDNIPADIRTACGLPSGGVLPAAQGSVTQSTPPCSPVHPNQSVESVTKEGQVKTSAAVAELVYTPDEKVDKGKQGEAEEEAKGDGHEGKEKVGNSKLVEAWKDAHAAAGLTVPELSALEGYQLGQIAKGVKAVNYAKLRDVVIPKVVLNWQAFCGYAKSMGHVHFHSNAPFPPVPSVGFLLKYRKSALGFVANLADAGEFEKEMVQFWVKTWPAEVGALPKGLPKLKSWNTPIWKGHPEVVSSAGDKDTSWDVPPELE